MNNKKKDEGVVEVLLERFEKQRLPRLLEIKKHVDAGMLLSETDLLFLEKVNKDALNAEPLVKRHPEFEELYVKAVNLYKEIIEKALENEKTSK